MNKITIIILMIFILLTIGCTSIKNEEYKFYVENIENGVLTYVGGGNYYHKIFSDYKIINIGDLKSNNAILKINIYLNNKIIHQELIDIQSLMPNENITKKLSYNYNEHEENNTYRLVAEILVNYQQKYLLENIIKQ